MRAVINQTNSSPEKMARVSKSHRWSEVFSPIETIVTIAGRRLSGDSDLLLNNLVLCSLTTCLRNLSEINQTILKFGTSKCICGKRLFKRTQAQKETKESVSLQYIEVN